jgi:hypothetical protein
MSSRTVRLINMGESAHNSERFGKMQAEVVPYIYAIDVHRLQLWLPGMQQRSHSASRAGAHGKQPAQD